MGIVTSQLTFLFNHSVLSRHIPVATRHVLFRLCWYKVYTRGFCLTKVPTQQQQSGHYLECLVFTLLTTVCADFLVESLIHISNVRAVLVVVCMFFDYLILFRVNKGRTIFCHLRLLSFFRACNYMVIRVTFHN